MQKLVIFVLASFAVALARPGEPINPLPKPEDRQRETKWRIEDPAILNLQHREKVFENPIHRVDASALLQKDFLNKMNPTQAGARVDYNYKPANTNVAVEALNAGRFGTQVGVEATRTIFKNQNSALDVGASYGQHFGGPGGRGEPVFGGFVRGHW